MIVSLTIQHFKELVNGSEFGAAATAGKLLRDAVRTLMLTAADNRVTARITQLMTIIKNYDTTSLRGERTVGIAAPGATDELKNFDFNISAVLSSILYKPYEVDTATGVITIAGLVPINDIAAPTGATHVTLRGAWAKVDFTAGTSNVEYTNAQNLPVDGTSASVTLTPAAVPTGSGTSMFLLAVEFFQEVNGVQYTLKNGAYNALSIVEVA